LITDTNITHSEKPNPQNSSLTKLFIQKTFHSNSSIKTQETLHSRQFQSLKTSGRFAVHSGRCGCCTKHQLTRRRTIRIITQPHWGAPPTSMNLECLTKTEKMAYTSRATHIYDYRFGSGLDMYPYDKHCVRCSMLSWVSGVYLR
jgi:hypothetical protein